MAKKDREMIKGNLRKWLTDFRKLAGQDIIVNIRITNKDITFVSCYAYEEYKEAEEPEQEPPSKPLFNPTRLSYFG